MKSGSDSLQSNVEVMDSESSANCIENSGDSEQVNLKRKTDNQIVCESKKSRKDEAEETVYPNEDDDEEYYLTLSNLPVSWTYVEIKNYLDTECGPIDEIEMLNNGKIRLTFQSLDKCKETLKKLNGNQVEGVTLHAEITELSIVINKNIAFEKALDTSQIEDYRPWRPDLDINDSDPKGLYGLRLEFLKSLGITPPLDRWVYVTKFRCGKMDLRDVMELAGNVIMCYVNMSPKKYAKVMYSHPLEAVQAIAMLNGQSFYGQPLKIEMFKSPDKDPMLPKGLTNIGLGLGPYGKPLHNVVQEFRKLVTKRDSLLNPLLFSKLSEQDDSIFEENDWNNEVKNDIDVLLASTQTKSAESQVTESVDELYHKELSDEDISQDKDSVKKTDTVKPLQNNVTNNSGRLKPPFGPPSPSNNVPANSNIPTIRITPRFPRPNVPPVQMQPIPGPVNGPRPFPGPSFGPQPMQRPFGPGPMPMQPGMNFQGQFRPNGPMQGVPGPMQGPMTRPMQGPIPRPMAGPMPGPIPRLMAGPIPRPMPGPIPRPMQGPQGAMFGPIPGPTPPGTPKVTLEFKNLPPSTTFPMLCDKLSQCGQVMSVQLTTPGCAVATFGHPSQADRCFQTYNGMIVEGYTLSVHYV